jgi:hypothetical protein
LTSRKICDFDGIDSRKSNDLPKRRANDRHFLPERQHDFGAAKGKAFDECSALNSSDLAPSLAAAKGQFRRGRSEIFWMNLPLSQTDPR